MLFNLRLPILNVDNFIEQIEVKKKELELQNFPIDFQYRTEAAIFFNLFNSIISPVSFILISYFVYKQFKVNTKPSKGGGGFGSGDGRDIFSMGKSNVKIFGVGTKVKTKFKDVAGQDEAKQEIQEFVDFLKKPKKYKDLGAKIPKGALLTGPPGTGKTLLAKACAGEAGVPFFFISGSDFVEMFVGVGASRVRDLFKQAKEKSPSIIFIDEIDAVGRKRENKMGSNDERDNTLNQLLVEMDGFDSNSNVIVLAATNRKELLDPALTRPGRFDRSVDITNPDIDGRKQIFMVHLKPLKLHPQKTMEDYAKRLATLTPGFSGADIMNLCNEAAIMAARKNKKFVDQLDFELASERVIGGLEKKRIISEEERRIVAVHESGHAVVSWFLKGGDPLLKITIIPRTKGSLGFAQYLPNENSLQKKSELMDKLCCMLGGRCAEQIFFDSITTGAYDDLQKAYELCFSVVSKYGMNEKIGNIGYTESEYSKTYSDFTNKAIDDEIKEIIKQSTERTKQVILDNKELVDKLSQELLDKETLDLKQITNILGKKPFEPKSNYKAYLELQQQDEEEEQQQQEDEQNKQQVQKESNKEEYDNEQNKQSQQQKEIHKQ
ncbi:hypothetical protein IMG5_037830 [Ichthyophthirius multifiliis]|uniref:AAA+ ATPase domain-containing protein n=1 Tax=Ichthyophthirius multifiliis TaxID=5932 RepID=G0QLW7_ICHMU|nr:hypothetical protein IMG5_037830 [Ichthyophthirius multifiliis]EGR33789.1 hypothetical protein IMG5_037830 [Ichthyophthirius multifiliis]|eukprot:XP_004039013.1 hypothetical protein IMG5_037830 [Ichthyophthirius multifiliis]